MPTSSERRSTNPRRHRLEPSEPLQRTKKDRRTGERRSMPRAIKRVRVLCGGADLSAEYVSDLSLEGASFHLGRALPSNDVELRFRLPDVLDELRIQGTVVRTQGDVSRGEPLAVHVRFGPVDVKQELALARFLQEEARLSESRLSEV